MKGNVCKMGGRSRKGFRSIREKLLVYFIVATIIIGFSSIYIYDMSNRFLGKMDTMFSSSIFLTELEETLALVDSNLLNYLNTKQSDSLNNYTYYSSELQLGYLGMNRVASYDESELLFKNIANMIESYLEEAEGAIAAKRGRDINEYIEHYHEANKIYGYILKNIDQLKEIQLNTHTGNYALLSEKLKILQVANIVMIVSTITLCILMVIQVTYRITDPIERLSNSANELARGNFDVEEIQVNTNDEVRILAEAFNGMKANIESYIEELKNKAQTETRLMEEEMKNLRMKNLLDTAELRVLQSQINPHFLFNTLNAGVQLSMMEGAEETGRFLENMSALFRYNIRKLDKAVQLREEIQNVRSYCDLLKVRFGDMIRIAYCIDEEVTAVEMPPLILQPIVENAFIHGIGEYEAGGLIGIYAHKKEEFVEVVIEDNGKGMYRDTINRIYKGSNIYGESGRVIKGHTTGIGLANVIHRLRLFYNREDVIKIESSPGKGTRITIRLWG